MRGIFFIAGTGRSGTNLCQWMLNLHPGIKVVTETHFIRTLVRLFGKDEITFEEFFRVIDEHYTSDGSKKWIHFHIEAGGRSQTTCRSDFEAFCTSKKRGTVREFVEAFFQFCYGQGSYLLGDKTPIYGMHMSAFLELWPDAKFVHMIRDGRYAATSMQKHLGFVRVVNAGFPDKVTEYSYEGVQTSYSTESVSLIDCIRYWQRVVTAIQQESKRIPPDAYLEVRYEDLVLQPIRELRRIARFLGVPVTLNWLRKAYVVPRPFSLWRQRKRIGSTEYDALTTEVSSTLQAFGYSTTSYRFARFIQTIDGLQELVNWIVYRGIVARFSHILVKQLFSLLGLGVYPLKSVPSSQKRPTIYSPIHHNTKERINELYADPKIVEAYLGPDRLRFYEEAVELLRKRDIDYNGKRIADVGCGTGHLLRCIHDKFNPLSLTGLEYSEEALRIARTVLPNAEFYYFDIYEGTSLKFDIVFLIEVLEHLLFPDQALKNLIDMIGRSGVALVTVPDGRRDTFEGHINFWSPESWEIFVKGVCNSFDVETGLLGSNKNNFALFKHTGAAQ
jgi:SAM-dependent methyltransferase